MTSGVSNEDKVTTGSQGEGGCFGSFEVSLLHEAEFHPSDIQKGSKSNLFETWMKKLKVTHL